MGYFLQQAFDDSEERPARVELNLLPERKQRRAPDSELPNENRSLLGSWDVLFSADDAEDDIPDDDDPDDWEDEF